MRAPQVRLPLCRVCTCSAFCSTLSLSCSSITSPSPANTRPSFSSFLLAPWKTPDNKHTDGRDTRQHGSDQTGPTRGEATRDTHTPIQTEVVSYRVLCCVAIAEVIDVGATSFQFVIASFEMYFGIKQAASRGNMSAEKRQRDTKPFLCLWRCLVTADFTVRYGTARPCPSSVHVENRAMWFVLVH